MSKPLLTDELWNFIQPLSVALSSVGDSSKMGFVRRSKGEEFRHVAFDANSWKTFIHARLATIAGDRGALSLFGRKSERHRLFAEHACPPRPRRRRGAARALSTIEGSMSGVKAPGGRSPAGSESGIPRPTW